MVHVLLYCIIVGADVLLRNISSITNLDGNVAVPSQICFRFGATQHLVAERLFTTDI